MDLGAAVPALLLTVVLVFVNAFFVVAEFALVRVRETQLRELEASSGESRERARPRTHRRHDHVVAAREK